MRIHGLYLIVDPEQTRGRDPMEVLGAALRGGASLVQYRDKLRDKGDQLTGRQGYARTVPPSRGAAGH